MKLIDGHMHTRHPAGDWFVRCADARGYEAYAILSLSCMNSFFNAQNNDNCLAVKRADPKRCYFFAGLVHPCEDYRAHVVNWLDKGADGIKFIETKPTVFKEKGVDLSDEKFDAMFAELEKRGTPILWHVGDPATFWDDEKAPAFAKENGWFYGNGGYASLSELYAVPEKILARHPKLHICLCHLYFCGDNPAHIECLLDTYENVRLDITPGTEMYEFFAADPTFWRNFFIRYQDRIQLGTDTDFGDSFEGDNALGLATAALGGKGMNNLGVSGPSLNLPQEVIEKIVYHNFRAFAGSAPKPLAEVDSQIDPA